jgi:hypothetical protein
MSRSRRKQRLPKCVCGRHLVRPKASSGNWRSCPLLNMIDVDDDRFLKYRELRSRPLTEED